MSGTIANGVLIALSAAALLPMLALSLECLAALLPRRRAPDAADAPARVAVLIPAHDEQAVIETTLQSVMAAVSPGDRVVVVADNCSDGTADVVRRCGAEVLQRHDRQHRGKGYALNHGLSHLRGDPPDVVVVIDADCLVEGGVIRTAARLAHRTQRPVQALNLTDRRPASGPIEAVATLGNRFTGLVRPLGLARLGVPCRLLGTGMVLPWPVLGSTRPQGDNLVEDMQWGIDLAIAGHLPLFFSAAKVTSALPPKQAFRTQRIRWEQGHLRTAATQAPRLLIESLRQRRPRLFWMACDLAIPPLALLAALWLVALGAAAGGWLLGASPLPAVLLCGGGLLLGALILAAWAKFCRRQVPWTALLALPAYAWRKLPIYAGLLLRRQRAWVRTERETDLGTGD
jgi:cellulose synthase/poly-beta-1,6-N-acetylglucosamine synthase-like glycosyltransferase